MDKTPCNAQDEEVRKGPWTMEEDLILINYIANHGEGVWNTLAKSAGLKRTGKSCRLRWLNYLRPDVKRGNITPEEQLLIMELHSKWGNRWSKIAKHLPGRTDNEIKNFWRTRIQKHIKQAEALSGQSSDANEQASSSQLSTAAYTSIEDYSAPPQCPSNNLYINNILSTNSNNSNHAVDPQAFPDPTMAMAVPLPSEVQENYWSMEDLWLLNGD